MTRSIKRGYPYPAHGRAIAYPANARMVNWRWRQMIEDFQHVADIISKRWPTVAEIYAAIADAAKAQQE